MKQMQLIK
jgi:hypothetical protein